MRPGSLYSADALGAEITGVYMPSRYSSDLVVRTLRNWRKSHTVQGYSIEDIFVEYLKIFVDGTGR